MKKSILAAAVLAALSIGIAQADNTCNHGCNSGGGDPAPVTATGGSSTAFGGTGIGLGGAGIGSASATGGQGGSSSSTATGGQGGAGGTAFGGTAALIDSGNSSSSSASRSRSTATQGQSTSVSGSGNSRTANANNSAQSVTLNTPAPYIPVNTAYASPLTAGEQTCMGSSSGGVQGPGFGVSVGSTWTDGNCVALRDSARAQTLGMKDVAVAIMCQQAVFAKAMEATGRECPGGARKVAQNSALPDAGDRDLRPDWVRGE